MTKKYLKTVNRVKEAMEISDNFKNLVGYNMTEKEKQQAINKAAWNEFEKTGDFSALLDIRFIISDNVKKELKGKENAIQKV